jgi:hypothetical protein
MIGHNKKQPARGGKTMKKQLLLVFVVLLVLFPKETIGAQPISSKGRVITIGKEKVDLTGDGKKDTIMLTGLKFKTDMYKNLAINITDSTNTRIKIDLPKGYHPSLKILDINQDGVKDIFTSVFISKSEDFARQTVYTVKNSKVSHVSLPAPLILESRFLNDYKAKIKIRKTGKSYIFDLKKRKKYYEKSGVFYNGKLNEPTELMVTSRFIDLKPIRVGDKIGLKGTQIITGVTESDKIGDVESTWLYDQTEWRLINASVLKGN